eukprot:COSAG01_NODE_264_length_19971_cov_62.193923_14_plen_297_part_00
MEAELKKRVEAETARCIAEEEARRESLRRAQLPPAELRRVMAREAQLARDGAQMRRAHERWGHEQAWLRQQAEDGRTVFPLQAAGTRAGAVVPPRYTVLPPPDSPKARDARRAARIERSQALLSRLGPRPTAVGARKGRALGATVEAEGETSFEGWLRDEVHVPLRRALTRMDRARPTDQVGFLIDSLLVDLNGTHAALSTRAPAVEEEHADAASSMDRLLSLGPILKEAVSSMLSAGQQEKPQKPLAVIVQFLLDVRPTPWQPLPREIEAMTPTIAEGIPPTRQSTSASVVPTNA